MKQDGKWYSLDNQANIYPAVSNVRNTNVYRISCNLHDDISPELLQQAAEQTLSTFPYYSMIMRRGLFWFYLEPTDLKPKVTIETDRPCKEIFHIDKKELLFEITYYQNRLNLEAFHALSDGGGALGMFRVLLYNYIVLAYKNDMQDPLPVLDRIATPTSQTEDGFNKHYTEGEKRSPFKKRAFNIGGTLLPYNDLNLIIAEMSTRQIIDLCKEAGATITTYITALMLCAIHEEMMPKRLLSRDVSIQMPVDLRSMFPSQTFRNFFAVVDIRYNFSESPGDFPSVLASVNQQFKEKVTKDELIKSLNYNMSMQKNILARAVPLFIKNRIIRLVYKNSEKNVTTTISNVGRVTMPKEFDKYIKSIICLLNPTPVHRVKLCICSYEDSFTLNFTSQIEETNIQKYVIRHLADKGIDITITTNGSDASETL